MKNIRDGQTRLWSSEQFRRNILYVTKSQFINKQVLRERTGLRPTALEEIMNQLNEEIIVIKDIFVVSAIYRINKDPQTRYLLLIDGSLGVKEEEIIRQIVPEYISIWSVNVTEETAGENVEHGYLSKWFRTNMGAGFSFIDIDYLLYNSATHKTLLIEEKNHGQYTVGYGQLLSYEELLRDIIQVPANLLFLYIHDQHYEYFRCNIDTFHKNQHGNHFVSLYPRKGFRIKREKIESFATKSDLVKALHQ